MNGGDKFDFSRDTLINLFVKLLMIWIKDMKRQVQYQNHFSNVVWIVSMQTLMHW